ncbi:uncharacterized protein LOC142979852 isoform X1 [Anticarsia gemmatalis]|uniref:uncharacterized protein LOC142979852 isoform X1 n=1 Tax=Anticarsia gemmatalis TaxID=129554 RepID=UPI003F76E37D
MPSDGETPTRELAELVQHCETQDWELIIAADCNAHHPLWGSKDTNKRDITLATHAAANLIAGWHVSNEPSLADHRRVCFQIQHKQKDPDLYRNPRKTDISRLVKCIVNTTEDTLKLTIHLNFSKNLITASSVLLKCRMFIWASQHTM